MTADAYSFSVVSGSGLRVCAWCRVELGVTVRADARTCSQRCRQALHRFERFSVVRARASQPMRFAYADPPYPGKSFYYKGHRDYGGEVEFGAQYLCQFVARRRVAAFDGFGGDFFRVHGVSFCRVHYKSLIPISNIHGIACIPDNRVYIARPL